MNRPVLLFIGVTCLPLASALLADEDKKALVTVATDAEKIKFFESEVRPILKAKCLKCHGARRSVKGGLYLTSREGILKGGDLGPAVLLKKPGESAFLRAIGYRDENLQMPPSGKLDQRQIDVLIRWVKMGIPYSGSTESVSRKPAPSESPRVTVEARNFWSFRPVSRPEVPAVENEAWVRNPIDAFILKKLEENGLSPAPPAAPRPLLRRVSFGLTGLPPSPSQADAFAANKSPGAFDALVDQLLQSPQYGVRWARHWLDIVRYAETNSFERDSPKPNVWRYRDYVIDSLNADKPFTRFIREQLAGDELEKVTPETLIATGYYRIGLWDDEPTDRLQARFDELDDILATTAQVFLGLSINCARCHDHKLDPIPQADYYRMLAFFRGLEPYSYKYESSVLNVISPPERQKEYEEQVAALNQRKTVASGRVAAIENGVMALLTEEERRAAEDKKKRAEILKEKLPKLLNAAAREKYEKLVKEFQALEATKIPPLDFALSVKETGPQAPDTHVLIRGNANAKGEKVAPGFLSVLGAPDPKIPERPENAKSAGRRLVLANWIASEKNPLTARVAVNRVWQHHFGRGIARTPNNFGELGERPTHPELLDWLASEFMAHGWRLKHLHKLILTSNTYRMSSQANVRALQVDPRNQLFWRVDMRRLGAEEIRDSILAVNGQLNLKMGGPSVYAIIPKSVLHGQSAPGTGWGQSSPEERSRRSIYIHVKRSLITPILASFDFADTDASCPVRFATTQPTQALTMLNSDFMGREAAAFADRLRREAGAETPDQVRLALRLALIRDPNPREIERGCELIASLEAEDGATAGEAMKQFSLMVFNLNEFIYLD